MPRYYMRLGEAYRVLRANRAFRHLTGPVIRWHLRRLVGAHEWLAVGDWYGPERGTRAGVYGIDAGERAARNRASKSGAAVRLRRFMDPEDFRCIAMERGAVCDRCGQIRMNRAHWIAGGHDCDVCVARDVRSLRARERQVTSAEVSARAAEQALHALRREIRARKQRTA